MLPSGKPRTIANPLSFDVSMVTAIAICLSFATALTLASRCLSSPGVCTISVSSAGEPGHFHSIAQGKVIVEVLYTACLGMDFQGSLPTALLLAAACVRTSHCTPFAKGLGAHPHERRESGRCSPTITDVRQLQRE